MLKLKNNFIFAPIKTGYGNPEGQVTEKHLSFYARRSEYPGAVIPEPLYLRKDLRELPTQIGIDSDDKIEGLQKLTGLFHSTDTAAIAHLNHPGRMANPKIPGNIFLSSSGTACESGGPEPKAMDMKDISEAVSLFVKAAVIAQKSSFDIIELQFGHGYLAAQFLSPKVNKRTDKYGGSFENRSRFALEVLDAVKAACSLPVIVRISADEMIPDGIKLDEMKIFSKTLEQHGADAIHVSSGSACSSPAWYFQHMFVPSGKTWEFADAIRAEIKIPVIYVGRIHSFEDIENLKYRGAEYLAVGRALVADPDFIGKYLKKVTGPVRPCLACAEGCLGGVRSGRGLMCLVNPELELGGHTQAAAAPRSVAVVGGGLAGMEAALRLAERGHRVDLYENDKPGGQFNLAHLTPYKQSMGRLVPYYVERLNSSSVSVIKKQATADMIKGRYDAAVIATGSVPAIPQIDGLDEYHQAEILLSKNLPENKNVLIIGGGLIGVDIATALLPLGNKITIVKRTEDFGGNMEAIAKTLSLKMMKEKNVRFSDHTHIKKVEGRTVFAERDGEQIKFEDIDVVVVSTGMNSVNSLFEELKNSMPVFIAGDADKIGDAQAAISAGYRAAMSI